MNTTAKIALAASGGYLLGRTKKMKLALAFGMFLAGQKLPKSPIELLQSASGALAKNDQFQELSHQVTGSLMDAGKAAAGRSAERWLTGVGDRLRAGIPATEDHQDDAAAGQDDEATSQDDEGTGRDDRDNAEDAESTDENADAEKQDSDDQSSDDEDSDDEDSKSDQDSGDQDSKDDQDSEDGDSSARKSGSRPGRGTAPQAKKSSSNRSRTSKSSGSSARASGSAGKSRAAKGV